MCMWMLKLFSRNRSSFLVWQQFACWLCCAGVKWVVVCWEVESMGQHQPKSVRIILRCLLVRSFVRSFLRSLSLGVSKLQCWAVPLQLYGWPCFETCHVAAFHKTFWSTFFVLCHNCVTTGVRKLNMHYTLQANMPQTGVIFKLTLFGLSESVRRNFFCHPSKQSLVSAMIFAYMGCIRVPYESVASRWAPCTDCVTVRDGCGMLYALHRGGVAVWQRVISQKSAFIKYSWLMFVFFFNPNQNLWTLLRLCFFLNLSAGDCCLRLWCDVISVTDF